MICALFFLIVNINAQVRQVETIGEKGWSLWLDRAADWEDDTLYLPPVDPSQIEVHSPICGWERLFTQSSLKVQVPGTVEEYCWDALSDKGGLGNSGDYRGVSWWGSEFTVPKMTEGHRIKLYFTEGIRQRAEVFVNRKLVGYELVYHTPFEIDITDYVLTGKSNQLAVRITDHNGNFSWGDYEGECWGSYYFPLSHGFGGILGDVQLKVISPLHVSDVFVKNKPVLKDIDVELEITNEKEKEDKMQIEVAIWEAWQNNAKVVAPQMVYSKSLGEYRIGAGEQKKISFSASVPEARLWEIRNSNLYNLVTTVKDKSGNIVDTYTQRFGFRFLSVDNYGVNPSFCLNGKRTFLISAISWGFWPTNGMYPTEDLAVKHIQSAQTLGVNMLNFHRCMGNTQVLDRADEMGLLYYEEPGGYSSSRINPTRTEVNNQAKNKELANQLNSQRFLRIVKRDRNHPSLVYYNMVNEPGWKPDETAKLDMKKAHLLDPTRFISYGSGFMELGKDDAIKLHMLPYDQTQKTVGYCDLHNAGNSPGVYTDAVYQSPTNFFRNEKGNTEILIWGEEGAIASPPQLEKINAEIQKNNGQNGWDSSDYIHWLNAYKHYISSKGLTKYYPSITKLITSMADVMYYEHGRLLENVRIADDADVYIYNGYEDMKNDNFSGAVDVYRNIKGTPELLSNYAKPLYVAVKVRNKIGHIDETNLFDMFIINEHAISAGKYQVKASVIDPQGKTTLLYDDEALVSGGNKFSDFVTEKIPVALNAGTGYYKVKAELYTMSGERIATGHDEIFATDWKNDKITGKGAILGVNDYLMHFVKDVKQAHVEKYQDNMPKIDYLLLGSITQGSGFQVIPSISFKAKDHHTMGLDKHYYRGENFDRLVDKRISTAPIDFNQSNKIIPGYDILGQTNFSLRWEGYITAEHTGETSFELTFDDGARIWFDGNLMVDEWKENPTKSVVFKKYLEKGRSYPIKIEAFQQNGGWELAFKWKLPIDQNHIDIAKILTRVKEDGTKLFLIEDAENWIEVLSQYGVIPEHKVFHPAKSWVGSTFFVREHPFFEGLPVNGAMNWEYQQLVVYNGPKHFGLYDMKGEDPVVSLLGSPFHEISTSVGILPYGNGKIIFSSLDLTSNLSLNIPAAHVPKKIMCNYLKWAER